MTWNDIEFLQKGWIKKTAIILANLMTLGNVSLAILAIVFIFLEVNNYILLFAKILAICGVLDFTDGKLARIGGSKKLAVDIDTIVDAIAFGILPAIFLAYEVSSIHIAVGVLTGLVYLSAVWYRLYRFVKRDPLYTLYFTGLPSPFAALVLSCLVVFHETPAWEFIIATLVISGFMISKTPFPSFKGVPSKFDLFWIISTTVIILCFIFFPFSIMVYPAYFLATYMVVYLIFSPEYALKLEEKRNNKKNS
ncbi:MAG: CDP-alcohol phosphatidyltransferase family protein [Candidatus Heimdallarchaeaceae archaeon]